MSVKIAVTTEAKARRLLRFLFLWNRAMSFYSRGSKSSGKMTKIARIDFLLINLAYAVRKCITLFSKKFMRIFQLKQFRGRLFNNFSTPFMSWFGKSKSQKNFTFNG